MCGEERGSMTTDDRAGEAGWGQFMKSPCNPARELRLHSISNGEQTSFFVLLLIGRLSHVRNDSATLTVNSQ